jgi:hypothetical protein
LTTGPFRGRNPSDMGRGQAGLRGNAQHLNNGLPPNPQGSPNLVSSRQGLVASASNNPAKNRKRIDFQGCLALRRRPFLLPQVKARGGGLVGDSGQSGFAENIAFFAVIELNDPVSLAACAPCPMPC